MIFIGPKTIDKMKELAGIQIDTYADSIDKAFARAEGNKLKITFNIDLAMAEKGIAVDSTISYVVDRIKDKQGDTVNETQADLFPAGTKVYTVTK